MCENSFEKDTKNIKHIAPPPESIEENAKIMKVEMAEMQREMKEAKDNNSPDVAILEKELNEQAELYNSLYDNKGRPRDSGSQDDKARKAVTKALKEARDAIVKELPYMEDMLSEVKPGLKIVYPSTPADVKGLLISAIEDPNPVLFFEHKGLYRSLKGEVSTDLYNLPLGKANIVQSGSDATIITYGKAVHWAMDLVNRLGVSVEIIDLRTLMPWDRETVITSIQKTNRALVLHEANITGGIGAEIASIISEEAFDFLDAPIKRIASLDTPIPFASHIESNVYLPHKRFENALRELLKY